MVGPPTPPEAPAESITPTEALWELGGIALPGNYADAEVVEVREGFYRTYVGEEPEIAKGKPSILSAKSENGVTWELEAGTRIESGVFPDVLKLPRRGTGCTSRGTE